MSHKHACLYDGWMRRARETWRERQGERQRTAKRQRETDIPRREIQSTYPCCRALWQIMKHKTDQEQKEGERERQLKGDS